MVFCGTIDEIPCITLDANFLAMTNTEVLSNVGPMLKRRDGRAYRQRAGQNRNEYLRAVAYLWIARYLFGYVGWSVTRPLPACIYQHIRAKYPTGQATTGYISAQNRAW
eukprot:gene13079-14422_t